VVALQDAHILWKSRIKKVLYEYRREKKLICDDVTDMVGFTPMVRINNITKKDGITCEICK
jgi:hypothetical protein